MLKNKPQQTITARDFHETYAIKSEEHLQQLFVQYIDNTHPDIIYNSDLSGIRLPVGLAAKVSRLRSSKSQPDISVYEPRANAHGLFLELKKDSPFKKDGTLKKQIVKRYNSKGVLVREYDHLQDQMQMLMELRKRGYVAEFGVGLKHSIEVLELYLSGNMPLQIDLK